MNLPGPIFYPRESTNQLLRCLNIARSHALLSYPRNTLALLFRALEKSTVSNKHLSSIMDTSDTASPPNMSISASESTFLQTILAGEVQRYRALVELLNLSETAQKNEGTNHQPLVERLNEYPAKDVDLLNLVAYPPRLELVPVKPLFFDAAWNYIEYPGRMVEKGVENGAVRKKGQSQEQAAQSQKKGWFGFGR